MRPKALIFTCIFLGAATFGHTQQNSVTLLFPDEGEREVWVQTGRPSAAPSDSVRTRATSLEVPTGSKKPTDLVFVWDKRTGNLASRSVKEIQSDGTWVVKPETFKEIAQLKVHVEHSGQPLAAANVSVNDGARTQTALLDPSTKGDVEFFGLKPGQLKVTASYKAKTGEQKSVTQLVDAPFTRAAPVPSAVISVADDVATVGSEPAASPATTSGAGGKPRAEKGEGASAAPESKETENGGNTIGSIIVYFIGLAIAGGVAFLLYRYATQNKALVEEKLKQMGVDIPQPGDDQGGPIQAAAPVMPKKPEPPQKIILDDAAPDPLGSVAPVSMAAPIVTGEPKLISEQGDAMPLPGGETVVGRDVGLGLSLVGESTVSRRHAQLIRNGGEVTLVDLGSTNGSYVNGAKVQGSTVLRSGDHVQFGAVKFRYEG